MTRVSSVSSDCRPRLGKQTAGVTTAPWRSRLEWGWVAFAVPLVAALAVCLGMTPSIGGCARVAAGRCDVRADPRPTADRSATRGDVESAANDGARPRRPDRPSGGRWVDVGRLEHCSYRPRRGRLVYTQGGAIRIADFETGAIREMQWSARVSLPTLIDADHVLFSSGDELVCIADVASQTVDVVLEAQHYAGLGYRAKDDDILYAGPSADDHGVSVWVVPRDRSATPRRTEVRWSPVGDTTQHRRIRTSLDGSLVSLPRRPTDASAPYYVVSWPGGCDLWAALDEASDCLYGGSWGAVDFGYSAVYGVTTTLLGRDSLLTRYARLGGTWRVETLRRVPPDALQFTGTLAVSERLGVVIVGTDRPHTSAKELRVGPLRGNRLDVLCDGEDPDIWSR